MADPGADNTLVHAALRGDSGAFVALCEQHRARLWRIIRSVASSADAEDLMQEVIIRAYRGLDRYRADAPFEAWLCRIAVNLAHDFQRSAWRRRVTLHEPGAPEVERDLLEREQPSTEGELERRELQRRVRQAVASLPERQRVPIWLYYFEGFKMAEVAHLESVSEGTVRSRVRAGLHRLSLTLRDLMPASGEAALLEAPAGDSFRLGSGSIGSRRLGPGPRGCEA